MRAATFALLASLLVTACAPSGYYDSNGTYHAYGPNDASRNNTGQNNASPGGRTYHDDYGDRSDDDTNNYHGGYTTAQAAPPQTVIYDHADSYRTVQATPTTTTTIIYDRPGAYDYNGYYIASDSGPEIPGRYFPPRGKCRVWFTDRSANQQPPVESCNGIDQRVPTGAYVVYGG